MSRTSASRSFSRRTFLGSIATTAATLTAASLTMPAWAMSAPSADQGLFSVEELREWQDTLVSLGPRIGGTESHRRWLDLLEDYFRRLGLETFRDTQYLTASNPHWNATHWSLSIVNKDGELPVPVSSYFPYSGETPPQGIVGELVDAGQGTQADFSAGDFSGKIALVTLKRPTLFADYESFYPTFDYLYDPDATLTPTTPFGNVCFNLFDANERGTPALAKSAGCSALIMIFDAAPANATGQYQVFASPYLGFPVLYVNPETGQQLKDRLAGAKTTVRFQLMADKGAVGVDNLTAILPGSNRDEYLWLLTHSDGCGECEENAGIALLSLARHVARLPISSRHRSLAFHLTLHMTPYVATNGAYFGQAHPDLFAKVVGLMHMEHFGQVNWYDDPATGTFRPTGYPELAFMDVSRSPALISAVTDAVRTEDLRRTAVANTTFSVGASYDKTFGTVGFMTYPNQMLSWGTTHDFRNFTQNLDKWDANRMYRETRTLARILQKMDAMPTAELEVGTQKGGTSTS